jgi:L-lactate dehydrogenase complex protein LldG
MSKHEILRRVREALDGRPAVDHPGDFESWGTRPEEATFEDAFRAAGGEIEVLADLSEVATRIGELAGDAPGISVGAGVPEEFLPQLPRLEPRDAPVGVSMARGAVTETGSLLMDARDGRRAQLLPPTHLVVVYRDTIHPTLRAALDAVVPDLPSGLGLHSGPSKSADIGQILVKGVHGPGRVVALVVERG